MLLQVNCNKRTCNRPSAGALRVPSVSQRSGEAGQGAKKPCFGERLDIRLEDGRTRQLGLDPETASRAPTPVFSGLPAARAGARSRRRGRL